MPELKAQDRRLRELINEKKQMRDPLMEVLHGAQGIYGYLPQEVLENVAESLHIPLSNVYGVVTFYDFFYLQPRGRHLIRVCTGTSCYAQGASKLLAMLEEELGIKLGETTSDGNFTLSTLMCSGACSLAPVFMIGEEIFGKMAEPGKIRQIIDKFRF
ncbi:MAG: NADH-quinone oxidoreductase subunit NuoE [Candidatus Cloacimonetes bacterium]|nr:NADH-quinone oxidoreductase subunit NuoE [Candidatus Cloacimonadota bacterium]